MMSPTVVQAIRIWSLTVLFAPLRQVADLVLERPGEPGADVGPRNRLDADADAPAAVDPANVAAEVKLHPG
jgi:hypothetical protein